VGSVGVVVRSCFEEDVSRASDETADHLVDDAVVGAGGDVRLPSVVVTPVARSTPTLKSPESGSDLPVSGLLRVPSAWMCETILRAVPWSS
jgi:hypothetical protein